MAFTFRENVLSVQFANQQSFWISASGKPSVCLNMPTADRIKVFHQPGSPFWLVEIDGKCLRDHTGRDLEFSTSYAAFTAGWEALRRSGSVFDKSMEEAAVKFK